MHSLFKLPLLLVALLLAATLFTAAPLIAASFEFTITAQAAFDKMTAAAKKEIAVQLKEQYAQLQAVQLAAIELDKKINALHYSNEEELLATGRRIKEIDLHKISQLNTDVKQTRDKYEPLFKLYEVKKQQLAVAKSLKNKELMAVLKVQVESVKTAVSLAREDIRSKESALKTAKAAVASRSKQIKSTLSDIDALKIRIKAIKSKVSTTKRLFTAETASLNQAVRKSDSTTTLRSFAKLLSSQQQINKYKQEILAYEQQITSVIAKANSQFTH